MSNKVMYSRKLIGGSPYTLLISIPKFFVYLHNLKKGSELTIELGKNQELILRPK